METIFIYILKWALCLAVLYTPFALLLRKETFASLNRKLLLSTLIVSALLPAFVLRFTVEVDSPAKENILHEHNKEVTALHNVKQILMPADNKSIITWRNATILYFAGTAAALLWTIIAVARTISCIKRGTLWRDKEGDITIHCHANETAPFSWFSHIVISASDYKECGNEILLHEKGHIHHKHSYDMLLLGVIKAVQWFNPFIYLLENDIKDLHEYEADRYVILHHGDTRAYQLLILKKAIGDTELSLVNNFGTNNARKRIVMMARKESGRLQQAKWSYLIPATILLLLLFAKPEYIYKKTTADTLQETPPPAVTERIATTEEQTEKAEKPKTALPITAGKRKQKTNEQAITTKGIIAIVADTVPVTQPANNKIAEYANETFYEYRNIKELPADNTSNCSSIRKCTVRMQFTTDSNGKASNITPKGCNISMNIGNGETTTIEEMQSTIIAATTLYIESKEWAPAIIAGEAISTNYDAHIIYHNGETTAMTAKSTRKPLLIGSTPIY